MITCTAASAHTWEVPDQQHVTLDNQAERSSVSIVQNLPSSVDMPISIDASETHRGAHVGTEGSEPWHEEDAISSSMPTGRNEQTNLRDVVVHMSSEAARVIRRLRWRSEDHGIDRQGGPVEHETDS